MGLVTWNIFPQIIGFTCFFISAIAETNRVPFDLPEAESELVAGFHTEYASMKFAMFFIAEYTSMIAVSCLATILFFGGWLSPFPASWAIHALPSFADSDSLWPLGDSTTASIMRIYSDVFCCQASERRSPPSALPLSLFPPVNELIQGPLLVLREGLYFPVRIYLDARHAAALPL